MGQVAQRIVAKVGSVVASGDAQAALELEEDDDKMDLLHRTLYERLLNGSWTHGIEAAVDLTLAGRYYERFADHAVSVARRVAFVAGKPPRLARDSHPNPSHPDRATAGRDSEGENGVRWRLERPRVRAGGHRDRHVRHRDAAHRSMQPGRIVNRPRWPRSLRTDDHLHARQMYLPDPRPQTVAQEQEPTCPASTGLAHAQMRLK